MLLHPNIDEESRILTILKRLDYGMKINIKKILLDRRDMQITAKALSYYYKSIQLKKKLTSIEKSDI